jgi:hypothetical protein
LRSVPIFLKKDTYVKENKKGWDWWVYQFWFNSSGAFIGWVVLYCVSKANLYKLNAGYLAALIIAFLGITGHLPYAVLIGRMPGQK